MHTKEMNLYDTNGLAQEMVQKMKMRDSCNNEYKKVSKILHEIKIFKVDVHI